MTEALSTAELQMEVKESKPVRGSNELPQDPAEMQALLELQAAEERRSAACAEALSTAMKLGVSSPDLLAALTQKRSGDALLSLGEQAAAAGNADLAIVVGIALRADEHSIDKSPLGSHARKNLEITVRHLCEQGKLSEATRVVQAKPWCLHDATLQLGEKLIYGTDNVKDRRTGNNVLTMLVRQQIHSDEFAHASRTLRAMTVSGADQELLTFCLEAANQQARQPNFQPTTSWIDFVHALDERGVFLHGENADLKQLVEWAIGQPKVA